MPRFDPSPGQRICFSVDGGERWFVAVEHPAAPKLVHAMEGGKAWVYHLREEGRSNTQYALKVMKPRHRDPAMVLISSFLHGLKARPGLAVCERLCLSPERFAPLLLTFPALEYAILMPWISGVSWFDFLHRGTRGEAGLDQISSLQLATNLADVLAGLEAGGLAHCDLSAGNVLLDPESYQVELIDVEDLFSPGGQPPKAFPAGTPGYQHRTSAQGQWHATADRFAGTILLCEMLGWYDPDVRSASYGDSFFDPAEMQQKDSARFKVLSRAVHRQSRVLDDLFHRSWGSSTQEECPRLAEWAQACQTYVDWRPLVRSFRSDEPMTWSPLKNPAQQAGLEESWEPLTGQLSGIGLQAKPFWVPPSTPAASYTAAPVPLVWEPLGPPQNINDAVVEWKGGLTQAKEDEKP